ncbi:T9SS type A sorting domain-containing protein [candidate division WOR-3 bacterium]|uniref:T9SS type A sorting domain-containing protein n=1 Tax=candidate division WOR-3 bacterium TaxID=2052148 RepID=A0A938BU50_UNCW3|nr:T9SS type A sorting domain-containing protein [candidate division WOR-3 bacterium]
MKLSIVAALLLAVGMAAAWDPDVRLTDNSYSDNSYWSGQRRVAVDSAGRIHVIWYVMNSGLGTYRFQVYYKRFNPGAGWTQDTMLSADLYAASTHNKYPAITVGSTGRVVAAWGNDTSDGADAFIYYKTCLPEGEGNGGWDSVARLLSNGGTGFTRESPNLAATPDGHVHAVWREVKPGGGSCIAYRELIDTVWQAQVDLELNSNYKVYPAIAGGPDNSVHVVWHGRNGPSGYYNVWYTARADSTWGAMENVSNGSRHQMYPSVAVDPATGEPHAIWEGYEPSGTRLRIIHNRRAGGSWQTCDTVSESGSSYDQDIGQVAFTLDGSGHAVWVGRSDSSSSVGQLRYSQRLPSGTWSTPIDVTDTTGTRERPSVAASQFNLHVVWSDYRDGNSEMYYKHDSLVTAVGEGEQPAVPSSYAGVNFVGTVLWLKKGTSASPSWLMDAMGRKVAELGDGANDVSSLAPGVYFVRVAGAQAQARAVRKVVVTR